MSGDIVLFESSDHEVRLDVQLGGQTVWLSQEQMSALFGRDVSTISRPIREHALGRADAHCHVVRRARLVERQIGNRFLAGFGRFGRLGSVR